MADARVPFDEAYLTWADGYVENDCDMRPNAPVPATDSERARLAIFVDEYCKPWNGFWDEVYEACGEKDKPRWCADQDAHLDHFGFPSYFRSLSNAIGAATNDPTRELIMWVLLHSLTPHVIMQIDDGPISKAVAPGLATYLRHATPERAIEIVRVLQGTELGLAPLLAREVSTYAASLKKKAASERETLLRMVKVRYADEAAE